MLLTPSENRTEQSLRSSIQTLQASAALDTLRRPTLRSFPLGHVVNDLQLGNQLEL